MLILLDAQIAGAIVVGQVDDFQTAATQDWLGGSLNVYPADSGPAGAGDTSYLVIADGGGPDGRMVARNNAARWQGDYPGAGATAISADVNNLTSVPLTIRLALNGAGGTFGGTTGVVLAPGSGWQNISLPIGAADLVPVGGGVCCSAGTVVNATLAAVSELRILHHIGPSWLGIELIGDLGIDNVTVVPEPASLALFAASGMLLTRRRRQPSHA